MTTTTFPASAAQTAFVNTLLAERDASSLQGANIADAIERGLTKVEASTLISLLLDCPKRAVVHQDGAAIEEGYFWVEGLVYKVQKSQTGNLYAKVFSEHGYTYAPGAIKILRSATRLTLEQAAEMGVKTGRCVVCGKTLTDPESVEFGVGPVCRLRF